MGTFQWRADGGKKRHSKGEDEQGTVYENLSCYKKEE